LSKLFARLTLLLVLLGLTPIAFGQSRSVSFNLSTSKSFSPDEQIKIHLYTHNVDALEFRVYRVSDPVRFIENLRELHSFGSDLPFGPGQQIDERTWLERFHDWKANLWSSIRRFFREQFSSTARREMRAHQTTLARKSRIVSEAEFAQIPLLNKQQLVARWRQQVPSTYVSDANDLPIKNPGAGLYLVEATDGRYKAYTLVMVSRMALVTRTASGGVLAYVVDRASGAPVAGAKVDTGFGQTQTATATTGADGVAQLAVAANKSQQDNFWVVASSGAEFAGSTPQSYSLNSSASGKWAAYIFTDRPVYRPTHTVHWKAVLREHDGNSLVLPKPQNVHVTIVDDQEKALFDRQLPINPAGYVAGDFDLPKDASLGYYSVRIGDGRDLVSGDFHVEEYRKPEYRVQVTAAQKRVLQGAGMQVTIDSRYFFGEPVANAKVKYRIYHERHFWYGDEGGETGSGQDDAGDADSGGYAGDQESEKTGTLNADGKLVLTVPTQIDPRHADFDYTIEAGVTDAANREITGRGRFLATYGTFRANIEPVSYAVRAGEAAKFRVTAIDYDGKPVQTRLHVRLVYRHYESGKTETIDGGSTDVTTDAAGAASGSLVVQQKQYSSAELEATAAAVQPDTRDVTASSYLWIMGASDVDYGEGFSQSMQIVADKKSYAPGDTAHLSIVNETAGFYALVVVQGNVMQKREVMHSDGKTLAFDLPITQESQPNITVEAMFIKDNTLYQASKNLKVPPVQQQLQVEITPTHDIFQPQQTAEYGVMTRDSTGKPVSAELSFGVVDEAIYSLYPDTSGDMVRRLYPERPDYPQIDSSLTYYFSGEAGTKSPMFAMRRSRYRPQLAQVKPGNEAKPRIRKAFPDTAYWNPSVRTDAGGHAHVSLTFPDSLTTWRATVHAITTDSKAGSAISRVLVRKNILVRMGTPRFLLKGDEIVLPVIVHNYLDTAKQAKISLDVQGLETVSGSAQSVNIPSKGEATVLWRLRGAQVGTTKLVATAITDAESDALELSFPVEPEGVTKNNSQSGVIAENASRADLSIVFPAKTDPAAHSMRIEVSPSIAGSLFSALDYLTSFPYGCTEQTMSSFLPNVIVAETLSKLKVSGRVDDADLKAKMQAGLARLADYQHEDGGWGWWKEDESQVYMTAYVVGGIGQGSRFVPLQGMQNAMLERGKQYLTGQLAQHPRMRPELRAAVVYALAQAGDKNIGQALDLQWSRRNDLEPEALAMTGLAMLAISDNRAAQIAGLLESKAVKKGELVSWKGSYVPLLDAEYENDAEATAYALRLLAKTDPASPLLGGAVQWLMLNRSGGAWWDSTEQTAMVLFGMVDYLAASHELESDFTAGVLVNGRSAGTHHFTPADTLSGASLVVDLDAAALQPGANKVEVVRRDGSGRVYWSASGRYYTTDRSQYQAGTMSLNLTRDYYKLQPSQKDGNIVYTLQPLTGEAQIGDVLAVHEAINGSPMKYLLLEDPIPAGTEFVTSEDSYRIDQRPGGWYEWYTRREFHDDRAAFFSTTFNGRQEIFYLLKVVNAGTFHISPASVEPMYQPGIQATSDALQLHVPEPPATGGPR
jgi:alpha-2-macroglobulin